MMRPGQLFKPMMIGWVAVTACLSVVVTVVSVASGGRLLAGRTIFGVSLFLDGMDGLDPVILYSVIAGIGVFLAGCLQGFVNWLFVSFGLLLAGLVGRRRRGGSASPTPWIER